MLRSPVFIIEIINTNPKPRKSILRIGIITYIIFGAQEAQNFRFFGTFFKSVRKCENRSKMRDGQFWSQTWQGGTGPDPDPGGDPGSGDPARGGGKFPPYRPLFNSASAP